MPNEVSNPHHVTQLQNHVKEFFQLSAACDVIADLNYFIMPCVENATEAERAMLYRIMHLYQFISQMENDKKFIS